VNDTYSHAIRAYRGGVFKNPYQGNDKKVVFVCSMGILRSATGARIYAHKYNTRTAGSWADALVPLTENLILWADELVFVNKDNFNQIQKRFEDDEDLVATVQHKSL
jgi:protein-tyrosine-phosphatase